MNLRRDIVEEYDRMQNALALLKILQHSETDVRKGRLIPQETVFRQMEAIIQEAKRNRNKRDR